MSAVLLVTKDKKLTAKVAVTGNSFVMGRSPDCNIQLDEELASRQHAEIILERGSYWIRDRGSRNGTSVNGEKISGRRELSDGDEIGIGATRLKFVWDKNRQNEDEADDDKTRAAVVSDLGKESAGQPVKEKKDKGDLLVKLRVVDGPLQGGVFRDWEGPLTIGRGLENNVVLLDDAVSTAHAQIVQDGDSYFVVDLKSSNGTFLDGVKVQKEKLSNGQKIKVGVSTLVIEMVDLRRKRKNLKIVLISTTAIIVVAALVKFLQPPDIAGQHIAIAQKYEAQGDFSNALAELNTALMINPNRSEAKREQAQVKKELDARDVLAMAEGEAAAENYDKAKELCDRVLRDLPNNSKALELQAVINSIENAKIAFTSQNWTDAKRLLEKAQEGYPNSGLIRLRLAQAKSELTAQQNLANAKDALQHQQLDMAQPLLQSIPTNSVYFVEAKQALDQIAMARQVAEHLSAAQAFYQNGNITEALAEIGTGLQLSASNPQLLDFQKHLRQMDDLTKPLAAAEAMSEPDDVDALLQNRKACNDVINLEADPLNALRKRAQAAEARISDRLSQLAQAYSAKAAETLQTGNQREALRLYDLAVKANPDDQDPVAQRDKLRQQIEATCRELYDKGIVHQDLGQTDMARQAFQQILTLGFPGEKYYDLATRKLKGMSQ